MLSTEPLHRSFALRLLVAGLLLVLVAGACSADGPSDRAVSAADTSDTAQIVAATAAPAEPAEPADGSTDPQSADDGPAATSTPVVLSGARFSFDATPAFLAYAAQQVDDTETFRFEFFQEVSGGALGETGSREVPLVTGESAGDTMQMRLDLSAMLANIPLPGFESNSDFSMNIVSDATVMYLNAPFFQAMLSPDGSAIPGFEWMPIVANGWGRVGLDSLDSSDVLSEFGMSSVADATALLSLLESVGEVRDGGLSDVRGEPTQLMYATVNLADLADSLAGVDTSPQAVDTLDPITVAVHIDASGYVRRISYTVDARSVVPDGQNVGAEAVSWAQLDLLDFDMPLDIKIPDGAVDITEGLIGLSGPGR